MRKSFFLALLLLLSGSYAYAGSVEFVTYYPAPYGVYDRVRLVPRAALGTPCDPGSMYVNSTTGTLRFCAGNGMWGDIPDLLWTKVGSNLYPADNTVNVGIGTTAPTALLHIVRAWSGADGDKLIVEDTAATHTSALITMKGTNRSWGIGATNPPHSAGDGKLIIIDRTATDTARMTIDTTGKIGFGTTSPEFRLTLDKNAATPDGGILAIGSFGSGNTLATGGAGARLIWYPRKAAFRAGYVDGTQWNDNLPNIGDYSVAMGKNTQASGSRSTAMGDGTAATGAFSTAMGSNTAASGSSSTAMGGNTAASGSRSTAMGRSTTASGDYSTTLGINTEARAYASVVLGRYNVISGTTNSWVNTEPLFVIGMGTDAANPANALTVLKDGKVGIGTATPGNKLHVTTGAIKATGGLIIQTGTAAPASPVDGQFWLCTDTGDTTPCNGI